MKFRFESSPTKSEIYISGAINEETEDTLGKNRDAFSSANIDINCRDVTSVNSIGISHWTHFFISLDQNPVISFYDVPEILMDAAQAVRHFFGSGAVKSFYVSANCDACDLYTRAQFSTDALNGLENFPAIACESCGKEAELDEELADYRAVLSLR